LHYAGRDNGRVLSRGQNQSGVDEFSRPKLQFIIRKRGLEFHRASCRIDFVVHDRKRGFRFCGAGGGLAGQVLSVRGGLLGLRSRRLRLLGAALDFLRGGVSLLRGVKQLLQLRF